MSVRRGDVVLVRFTFADRPGIKPRPALVVQDNALNHRLSNTILASISTNYRGTATQLFIDVSTPDGQGTGLRQDSAVLSENLTTIDQAKVHRVIGSLSAALMAKVDDCLKAALGLP
jgi:mRNA interferase MazF